MNTVTTQKITVSVPPRVKGSTRNVWNYSRNGEPFGQIWTFRNTRSTWHPYHAKTLAGDYQTFDRLFDADIWMRGKM